MQYKENLLLTVHKPLYLHRIDLKYPKKIKCVNFKKNLRWLLTPFSLFHDQGTPPPFQMFVQLRTNLWMTSSKQIKMRCAFQK